MSRLEITWGKMLPAGVDAPPQSYLDVSQGAIDKHIGLLGRGLWCGDQTHLAAERRHPDVPHRVTILSDGWEFAPRGGGVYATRVVWIDVEKIEKVAA